MQSTTCACASNSLQSYLLQVDHIYIAKLEKPGVDFAGTGTLGKPSAPHRGDNLASESVENCPRIASDRWDQYESILMEANDPNEFRRFVNHPEPRCRFVKHPVTLNECKLDQMETQYECNQLEAE
jgi:hypothetical protein